MISVTNLIKKYGTIQALNGISFTIKQGEFFGLFGPNGAGKTTTISIMSTILDPDEGSVMIADFNLKVNPTICKKNNWCSATGKIFLLRILVPVLIGTVMNIFALQMFKRNILKIA